jgi:ABC-type multidrug transport system fused ATPase/permease subunit
VFQGGLLLTYLVFIFNQNPWLGLAAVALYPPQVYLIPRLQRKINALSKERVQTARALSDRIGESVSGSAEIRSNDTFHLEAADISDRLGTIFGIRVDIYRRKFFVKFLNNFLAQVTPFFFYSVGGYFVIKGSLSLGALVAVLGAYKDILDPWKELLQWYSTKEDVRIKYEQIVSQFEPPGLIDAAHLRLVETVPKLPANRDHGARLYRGRRDQPRRPRFVRDPDGAARCACRRRPQWQDDIAHLVARLVFPTGGRIVVAGGFAEVHQAIPGRRIAYATQNAHIFSGTLRTTSTASSISR